MDRDPGDFQRGVIAEPASPVSEDALGTCVSASMPSSGGEVTEEEFAASIARAREDVDAGRTYPHAIVGEWLLTWGKPGRKPFKEWLADTHG